MRVKINLCDECAAKLKVILNAKGENAMARAIGKILCTECKKQLPFHGGTFSSHGD